MQNKHSFHSGEIAVQRMSGESAIAAQNSVVIADTVLGGARPFIQKQFMVVMTSVDSEGAVWSSLIFGSPGFVTAESDVIIKLDIPVNQRDYLDPFWTNISQNVVIGILFIELATRRRYRINGVLQSIDDAKVEILIREAYPNCPKFIQRRHLLAISEGAGEPVKLKGNQLEPKIKAIIKKSDTIFVASYYSETGADASHRGGNRGFIQIVDETTLKIPDYSGNSLFNTFGNIEVNSNTGICIPDFDNQYLLQLTGKSQIKWNQEDPLNLTGGTRRFWEFKIDGWLLRKIPHQLKWEYLDASPFNLPVA